MRCAVLLESFEPFSSQASAARTDALGESLTNAVGNKERFVGRPVVKLLGESYLFDAEGLAVRRARVLFVRRTPTNVTVNDDECRSVVSLAIANARRSMSRSLASETRVTFHP